MGKQTVFVVIFGSVVCWKYELQNHVDFVFRPRVNLIHNQTLRRPSRGKERSDSARPDYKPSKTLFLRCFECQRIDLLEATLGQASIRNITMELLARF